MMAQEKKADRTAKRTAPAGDVRLLQARLPKDLVFAFRSLALVRETTVRALLEETIRERLRREGFGSF